PRHQRLLQRPHRGDQLADQEGQAGRARLPQLRKLPAAAAAALRRQVADAANRTAAGPLTPLGGARAANGPGGLPLGCPGSTVSPWPPQDLPSSTGGLGGRAAALMPRGLDGTGRLRPEYVPPGRAIPAG